MYYVCIMLYVLYIFDIHVLCFETTLFNHIPLPLNQATNRLLSTGSKTKGYSADLGAHENRFLLIPPKEKTAEGEESLKK